MRGNMTYIYTPYLWPFIAAMIVNIIMIFYLMKKWHRVGAAAFMFTLALSSLWCLETAMELCGVTLESKLLWAKIGYFSHSLSPVTWMIMILQLTDWQHWINRKRIMLLFVIPILTIIFVWTNDFHGLIWKYVYINTNNIPSTLSVKHGYWFWIHAVYSDGMNLLSIILTVKFWVNKAPLYGRQFAYLTVSMLFVILANAAHIFGIGPKIDTTSIAWGISSVFITWALFRNKLFDIVPIARNRIMESMADGILVMDSENRIVDMNFSALKIFNCEAVKSIGVSVFDFLKELPELSELVASDKEYKEFEYFIHGERQYYEASCLPVKNERENVLGKLLVIHDITEKKTIEKKLLQKQMEIAAKEERDRMARDLHDNLGQILGFINVQAQASIEYLKHDQLETATQCLERLTEVAQDAHSRVRHAILLMRSETEILAVNDNRLSEELSNIVERFKKRYSITIDINFNELEELKAVSTKKTDQILNIIKEALNNVVKHSKADTVKITFENEDDYFTVTIKDNGCGFNINNNIFINQDKYGILFMKERAKEIGGKLHLYSEIGTGTTVKIQVPNDKLLKENDTYEDSTG